MDGLAKFSAIPISSLEFFGYINEIKTYFQAKRLFQSASVVLPLVHFEIPLFKYLSNGWLFFRYSDCCTGSVEMELKFEFVWTEYPEKEHCLYCVRELKLLKLHGGCFLLKDVPLEFFRIAKHDGDKYIELTGRFSPLSKP